MEDRQIIGLSLSFSSQEDGSSWVSWLSQGESTQWCLWGQEPAALLNTAQQLILDLGYNMAVVPLGGEDAVYQAVRLGDMTVGEVAFTLVGFRYTYRMASTGEIRDDFQDISGMEGSFAYEEKVQFSRRDARIYYNDGGKGKLV